MQIATSLLNLSPTVQAWLRPCPMCKSTGSSGWFQGEAQGMDFASAGEKVTPATGGWRGCTGWWPLQLQF